MVRGSTREILAHDETSAAVGRRWVCDLRYSRRLCCGMVNATLAEHLLDLDASRRARSGLGSYAGMARIGTPRYRRSAPEAGNDCGSRYCASGGARDLASHD